MKKLMNILLLSCKQATALSSKKSFEPLSFKEQMKFRIHTSMCKACKAFDKQNTALDKVIDKIVNDKRDNTLTLSDNQKSKIKNTLSE